MFERISRSWQLVKASYGVLRSDKELILYPIISFISTALVTITFIIPLAAAGIFDALTRSGGIGIAGLIVGFLYYLVLYTVIIFSNTALVGAAMIRFEGGDPTLGDGFRVARQRGSIIIGYALISATIGMILRLLRERGGLLGAILAGLGNLAWNLITFLVIPVLVVENIGPIEAIKRSGDLLKKTWGEQIVGNFSISSIFGLLMVVAVVLGVLLIIVGVSIEATGLVVAAVIALVLALIVLALVGSTLSGIYQAALYRYATTGEVGGGFDPELIRDAFKEKPKRGLW